MPALQNPKHERFAQLLAKGSTADDAYSQAGYRPDRKNAARLTTKDDIRTRLRELQDRAAMRVELTVADIVRQLAEDREFAIAQEAPAAAISATLGQAKVLGLVVDKSTVDVKAAITTIERRIVRPELPSALYDPADVRPQHTDS